LGLLGRVQTWAPAGLSSWPELLLIFVSPPVKDGSNPAEANEAGKELLNSVVKSDPHHPERKTRIKNYGGKGHAKDRRKNFLGYAYNDPRGVDPRLE
jgi:hypothetical protein